MTVVHLPHNRDNGAATNDKHQYGAEEAKKFEDEYCGLIPCNPSVEELKKYLEYRANCEESRLAQADGYRAQAAGKHMVEDNPHHIDHHLHWEWRTGFIEAFKDSH